MTDNQLSLLFLNTYDVFWWCILCAWCIIYHDIVYNSNIIFLRIIYVTVISIVIKLFGPYNKWTKIFFKFCFLFIIYCPAFLLRNDVHSIHWNWLDNFLLCDVMAQVLFVFEKVLLHFCQLFLLEKCIFNFVNLPGVEHLPATETWQWQWTRLTRRLMGLLMVRRVMEGYWW